MECVCLRRGKKEAQHFNKGLLLFTRTFLTCWHEACCMIYWGRNAGIKHLRIDLWVLEKYWYPDVTSSLDLNKASSCYQWDWWENTSCWEEYWCNDCNESTSEILLGKMLGIPETQDNRFFYFTKSNRYISSCSRSRLESSMFDIIDVAVVTRNDVNMILMMKMMMG